MTDRARIYLFCTLSVILSVGSSVVISLRTTDNSERKFCDFAASQVAEAQERVDGYRSEPPSTPAGSRQAEAAETALVVIRGLESKLECPKGED